MTFRLPPLLPIRAFEAAGRRLSVKDAADELNLTPSAVSHAIHSLEHWLEVDLFDRSGRTLRLTEAGRELLPRLTETLTRLAAATTEAPARGGGKVLRLSVAVTVVHRLLLDRLPRFYARNPALSLVLDTSHRRLDAPVEGVDLAIRISETGPETSQWTMLVQERVVPVCAPALLAGQQEKSVAAPLGSLPLIAISSVPREWDHWCAKTGVAIRQPAAIVADTIELALACAEQGLGIVLGRRPLIDGALASGKLVPVGAETDAPTALWLIRAEGVTERAETRTFRRWIVDEFKTPLTAGG